MKKHHRIALSLGAAILTASFGTFFFWSCGARWVPGEALGMAVGMTLTATVAAAFYTFIGTAPESP